MTTSNQVRVGQTRRAYGRDYVVMRKERGKAGEERVMVVLGIRLPNGEVVAREARARSTVASWPVA